MGMRRRRDRVRTCCLCSTLRKVMINLQSPRLIYGTSTAPRWGSFSKQAVAVEGQKRMMARGQASPLSSMHLLRLVFNPSCTSDVHRALKKDKTPLVSPLRGLIAACRTAKCIRTMAKKVEAFVLKGASVWNKDLGQQHVRLTASQLPLNWLRSSTGRTGCLRVWDAVRASCWEAAKTECSWQVESCFKALWLHKVAADV